MALDARAFTAFEQAAHDRLAKTYSEHFTPLTSLALEPLLKSARVSAGKRLLDVATGPSVAAATAHDRGAHVTGVDVSPGMIALARGDYPIVQLCAWPLSGTRSCADGVCACPGGWWLAGVQLVGPAGASAGTGFISGSAPASRASWHRQMRNGRIMRSADIQREFFNGIYGVRIGPEVATGRS